MIFGNRNSIGLEIDPLAPSWDRRSAQDRGPWAQFRLWVQGHNLTENVFPGTDSVLPSISVPLAPIADWLVNNACFIAHEESSRSFQTDVNLLEALEHWKTATHGRSYSEDEWDDERFSWVERHFIRTADPGSWLPNAALVRVGDDLWVSWAPPKFATSPSPRFIDMSGIQSVPWLEAENAFNGFVDSVGRELSALHLEPDYPWARQTGAFRAGLTLSWDTFLDVIAPAGRSAVLRLFHAQDLPSLIAEIGLPPDAAPEDSVAALALRDLEARAAIGDVLRKCEQDVQFKSKPDIDGIRARLRQEIRPASPEDQGYEAAIALREFLGLGSQPLNGFRPLIEERLGIQITDTGVTSDEDNCVAGARLEGCGVVMILDSPRTEKRWARRMEALRGVGHVLLDASTHSGAIGAGSSIRASGPRRRRSGAFAAEMLVPRAAMLDRTGAQLDAGAEPDVFEAMMADYGAGARTTAWQLYNAGLLSSREIVDELIERYGAADPGRDG